MAVVAAPRSQKLTYSPPNKGAPMEVGAASLNLTSRQKLKAVLENQPSVKLSQLARCVPASGRFTEGGEGGRESQKIKKKINHKMC